VSGPDVLPKIDAFRIGTSVQDPVSVMLRFVNRYFLNDFHQKYCAFKTLSTSDVGLQLYQRINISENLLNPINRSSPKQ
jgi:hypothetical protein